MNGYWFPICEDCDTDAVSLRHVDGTWWFHCPPHSRLGDRAIRDVELGWRPTVQDSPWNAALTAIRGVKKPGRPALLELPTPARCRRLAVVPDLPTIPTEPVLAHWNDDIPIGPEPDLEDWR